MIQSPSTSAMGQPPAIQEEAWPSLGALSEATDEGHRDVEGLMADG